MGNKRGASLITNGKLVIACPSCIFLYIHSFSIDNHRSHRKTYCCYWRNFAGCHFRLLLQNNDESSGIIFSWLVWELRYHEHQQCNCLFVAYMQPIDGSLNNLQFAAPEPTAPYMCR